MAISTNCCLNLSPPPSNSAPSSLPSKTTQGAWPRNERCWKSRCVLGITCMVVGFEMGDLIGNEQLAIANNVQLVVESTKNIPRWSDKRSCPPWRVNSLETIVPENLPRPSTRRRLEAVGYYSKVAPTVEFANIKSSTKCFTM